MNRRIVYKQQAKCNFCYNWFQVFSQIKFGLNICQACIYKALNTSCFKLPTPQGHLYQVYLAKRNISVNTNQNANTTQSTLLQKVDQFMHTQIRQLLQKWQQINKILTMKPLSFAQGIIEKQQQIWKKIQFILKNDSKKFNSVNYQTTEQLREDIIQMEKQKQKERTDRKMVCTPMKQKNINVSVKYLNKSNKKNLNRMDSKKSLRSYRDVVGKNSEHDRSNQKLQDQQNIPQGDQEVKKFECSPINIKRAGSSRGLGHCQNRENRQFVTKMQQIKANINNYLQQQYQRQQGTMTQPINIQKQRIYEAIQNTNTLNKCIELVSFNGLQNIDMKCYLSNLEWQGVEVVKFVKVNLDDAQLLQILQFLKDKQEQINIETLVFTGNNLTQESCRNLLRLDIKSLHNIYLGKNQIFSYKAKNEIKFLKSKYNFFL